MPTYEYECAACGHTFELFQSMTEKAVRKCPSCKKMKVERLIGAGAGIIFKGSGFYETDYKRKSGGSDSSASSSSSSTSSSKASGSSDNSKPPSSSGSSGDK